jgi:copper resistance protein C
MKTPKFMPFVISFFAPLALGIAIAWAHSFPEEETPAAGQVLTTPPPTVSIKYDAPIEHLFAKLDVVDGAGNDLTVSPPAVSSDGFTLSVQLKPLQPGDYTVKWAVVCIDTHHTEGSYTFSVTGKPS